MIKDYHNSNQEFVYKAVISLYSKIRHGAATGLREVIHFHGDTAGIAVHTPVEKVHSLYRQVCVIELIIILYVCTKQAPLGPE